MHGLCEVPHTTENRDDESEIERVPNGRNSPGNNENLSQVCRMAQE